MALNLLGSKKKKIAGAIILVVVVLLAILFALPIFGTGTAPLISEGGSTIGGGFGMQQGFYR